MQEAVKLFRSNSMVEPCQMLLGIQISTQCGIAYCLFRVQLLQATICSCSFSPNLATAVWSSFYRLFRRWRSHACIGMRNSWSRKKGLRISDRLSWVIPPWQTLEKLVLYSKLDKAVQLCRSLRFRGACLHCATAETEGEQVGVAAIMKYQMTEHTRRVNQEIVQFVFAGFEYSHRHVWIFSQAGSNC